MRVNLRNGTGKKLHLLLPMHLFLLILALALLLCAIIPVSALGTGVKPMDQGISAISNLFNIESLQSNEYVQIGFLKFALFMVLFAVSNQSLKRLKVFDKKTAGITAFAFSMIGVFMMPHTWLLATGNLITGIMSSLIFLGFFIGLSYAAVFILRPKKDNPKMGLIMHLLGLILLFLLLTLLDDWALFVGLPVEGIVGGNLLIKFYSAIISWTYLLITILIIYKLIIMLTGLGGGLSGGGDSTGGGDGGDERAEPGEPGKPEEPGESDEPEKPGESETPHDFNPKLDEIENGMNDFKSELEQIRNDGNQILITHRDHSNPPVSGNVPPDVTSMDWANFIQLNKNIGSLSEKINQLFHEVRNNSGFSKIEHEQEVRFVNLMDQWAKIAVLLQEYLVFFEEKFNRGEAP